MAEVPTNDEDRQAWIRFVNQIDWVWSKHSRLCLLHFFYTYIKYELEVTANFNYHDIYIPAKCPDGFHLDEKISERG